MQPLNNYSELQEGKYKILLLYVKDCRFWKSKCFQLHFETGQKIFPMLQDGLCSFRISTESLKCALAIVNSTYYSINCFFFNLESVTQARKALDNQLCNIIYKLLQQEAHID